MAGTPFHFKKHAGSWGFWAGVYGGGLRFPNEKWQGPLYAKKGEEEKKEKRGRELEKNTGVVENPNTRVR